MISTFAQEKGGGAYANRACRALVPVHLVVFLYVRARVVKFHSHVFLAPSELWRVNGDEEALDTALLRVLHDALRNFAVLVDVPKGAGKLILAPASQRKAPWRPMRRSAFASKRKPNRYVQLHKLDLARLRGVDELVKRAGCERRDLVTSISAGSARGRNQERGPHHLYDAMFRAGPGQIQLSVWVAELAQSGCRLQGGEKIS